MRKTDYAQSIDRHYTHLWTAPAEAVRLDKGPIGELPEEFRVLLFNRTPEMMAFATRGMSQPDDKVRLEIHLLSRPSEKGNIDLVEILTAAAHYHRTECPLGLGHSVNFGRSLIPGSVCDHGILSLPYLDGPKLEWLDNPEVRFLWLLPVTRAEVAFKKAHGLEALERRFEEVKFDYLDPFRASVV